MKSGIPGGHTGAVRRDQPSSPITGYGSGSAEGATTSTAPAKDKPITQPADRETQPMASVSELDDLSSKGYATVKHSNEYRDPYASGWVHEHGPHGHAFAGDPCTSDGSTVPHGPHVTATANRLDPNIADGSGKYQSSSAPGLQTAGVDVNREYHPAPGNIQHSASDKIDQPLSAATASTGRYTSGTADHGPTSLDSAGSHRGEAFVHPATSAQPGSAIGIASTTGGGEPNRNLALSNRDGLPHDRSARGLPTTDVPTSTVQSEPDPARSEIRAAAAGSGSGAALAAHEHRQHDGLAPRNVAQLESTHPQTSIPDRSRHHTTGLSAGNDPSADTGLLDRAHARRDDLATRQTAQVHQTYSAPSDIDGPPCRDQAIDTSAGFGAGAGAGLAAQGYQQHDNTIPDRSNKTDQVHLQGSLSSTDHSRGQDSRDTHAGISQNAAAGAPKTFSPRDHEPQHITNARSQDEDLDQRRHDTRDAALGATVGADAGGLAAHELDQKELKKVEHAQQKEAKHAEKEIKKQEKDAEKDAKKHEKQAEKDAKKHEKSKHKHANESDDDKPGLIGRLLHRHHDDPEEGQARGDKDQKPLHDPDTGRPVYPSESSRKDRNAPAEVERESLDRRPEPGTDGVEHFGEGRTTHDAYNTTEGHNKLHKDPPAKVADQLGLHKAS